MSLEEELKKRVDDIKAYQRSMATPIRKDVKLIKPLREAATECFHENLINTFTATAVWHPHSEPPVFQPGGDNRLLLCLNLRKISFGLHLGTNFTYEELNPDGSVNSCADSWHGKRWLKKNAVKWENLYPDTWWLYVREIIPNGI